MRQHWRVCCRCGCVTREIDEPGVFINGSLNADWRSHGAGRRDGRRRGAIGVGVDCYRGAAPSTPWRNDPSRAGRRTTTTKKNLKKRSDEPNLLSRWPHKKEKKKQPHTSQMSVVDLMLGLALVCSSFWFSFLFLLLHRRHSTSDRPSWPTRFVTCSFVAFETPEGVDSTRAKNSKQQQQRCQATYGGNRFIVLFQISLSTSFGLALVSSSFWFSFCFVRVSDVCDGHGTELSKTFTMDPIAKTTNVKMNYHAD